VLRCCAASSSFFLSVRFFCLRFFLLVFLGFARVAVRGMLALVVVVVG